MEFGLDFDDTSEYTGLASRLLGAPADVTDVYRE
jgi:hypothetical protein